MGMFDKKKKDEPVVFKEDKDAAKQRRLKALREIQEKGHKGKETKKGVQEVPPRTEKGRKEQAKRDEINKHAENHGFSNRATRKGFKSEWD